MTNTEFKKKIAAATDSEWFKNVQVTFNFPYIDITISLKGITAIYEFVNQQISGWEAIEKPIPNEIQQSQAYFQNIKNQIIQFVNSYLYQQGSNLNSHWSNAKNTINRTNQKPFTYDSPYTEFLIRIFKENSNYFLGAYNCITETNFNINNKYHLFGAILAYEFILKEKSKIAERRKAEQVSITKLKTDFQKYLTESEVQLTNHLNVSNKKFTEYTQKIDDLKNEKNDLFTKWFENTKSEEWQKWFEPSKKKIDELEQTYQVKLKLEEPAKYWFDRAKSLKVQGWFAMSLIIVLVVLTCWSLGKILWSTPEQIYSSWFQGDKSAAIRWSIVYVTLISFIAYCIRALTKVMFSSFHLARDCEERHTLTYFYLSLLKDSKVDEKDRQLIMQSLFSRAETGLLKDDSSPTMPSDSIGKIITTR